MDKKKIVSQNVAEFSTIKSKLRDTLRNIEKTRNKKGGIFVILLLKLRERVCVYVILSIVIVLYILGLLLLLHLLKLHVRGKRLCLLMMMVAEAIGARRRVPAITDVCLSREARLAVASRYLL